MRQHPNITLFSQDPTLFPLMPEEILDVDYKMLCDGKRGYMYLVKWKGLSFDDAKQEDIAIFERHHVPIDQAQYSEDNVAFRDGESYDNAWD